jgi:hypothetical protein
MGMTHIELALAAEDVLAGALRVAWKLRVEKNAKSVKKRSAVKSVPAVRIREMNVNAKAQGRKGAKKERKTD